MNTDYRVAKADELQEGEMKQVQAGEAAALLVRWQGAYHAFVAECPHHQAPLAEGTCHEGQIRCPWHQAVFDAVRGNLLEPPALDDLGRYNVRVEGDDVIVSVPDTPAETRLPAMATPDPQADSRTFVILGCGAAGTAAAQTLRQVGFRGRVVMLTADRHPPYDRTELSKRHLSRAEDPPPPILRDAEFCKAHGIELQTGRQVAHVRVKDKAVLCADGSDWPYDRLLIATGSRARTLEVPGEDLPGVRTLRTLDDANELRRLAGSNERAVVVGASFIGMETAAALTERKLKVTVVAPESVPFEKVFGLRIGAMFRSLHEENGTQFLLGRTVRQFEGDGKLQAVVLDDGTRLDAGLAVVGVGVRPVTEFLDDLPVSDDGSIPVRDTLQAAEDVWAAGDVARFPDWRTGEPIRIEHWRLAMQLGRVAAWNMAGKATRYPGTPFFWTVQHNFVCDYVGYAGQWDDIAYEGNVAGGEFVAYYLRDGRVVAAAGAGRSRQMNTIGELLGAGDSPELDRLTSQVRQPQAS